MTNNTPNTESLFSADDLENLKVEEAAYDAGDDYDALICDDCEATYAACLCGTDPSEYEDNYSDAEADADAREWELTSDYSCFDSGDDW